MGEWQECYAWRHLGRWADSADPSRINEVVELQILEGLGMPLGTADVVSFARAELGRLLTLMFSTTIFGWSVGDDLYVVPDHSRCILKIDHHRVIHVSCRTAADIDTWVKGMRSADTRFQMISRIRLFKTPGWMRDE